MSTDSVDGSEDKMKACTQFVCVADEHGWLAAGETKYRIVRASLPGIQSLFILWVVMVVYVLYMRYCWLLYAAFDVVRVATLSSFSCFPPV